MLGISMVYFEKKDNDNMAIYYKKAESIEQRLKEGISGIGKLENEGFYYSEYEKQTLGKIFKEVK
jgi:hypothetical protein